MKNLEHVQSGISTTQVVTRSTLVVAIAFLLPFIVHLLPIGGEIPLGARLLPIFYAPLLAAFWRLRVAGIATIAMPFVNVLLTGSPAPSLALIMTFEVALFLAIAWNLVSRKGVNKVTGLLSYLGAKAVSTTTIAIALGLGFTQIAPLDFATNSIVNGIPGLFVLAVISYLVVSYKRS